MIAVVPGMKRAVAMWVVGALLSGCAGSTAAIEASDAGGAAGGGGGSGGGSDFDAAVAPNDTRTSEASDDADAPLDGDGGKCACWQPDAGMMRRTSLDCLCGERSQACTSDYESTLANYRCDFNPYPMMTAPTLRIIEYASCGLLAVNKTAIDAPGITWIFDAVTHKQVGVIYAPGLADGYQPDLCTGRYYFGLTIGAGIVPESCVPSKDAPLCPDGGLHDL